MRYDYESSKQTPEEVVKVAFLLMMWSSANADNYVNHTKSNYKIWHNCHHTNYSIVIQKTGFSTLGHVKCLNLQNVIPPCRQLVDNAESRNRKFTVRDEVRT